MPKLISRNVVALSLDLVGSRKVQDRKGFAKKLEKTLRELKGRFGTSWLAPPVTARGIDELSGAMTGAAAAFDFLVALNLAVWPERFRMGIGVGTIDVGLESGDAADLDGTAFHNAAEAVRRAGRDGIPLALHGEGVTAREAGVIEALALLHARVLQGWHGATHAAAVAYRERGTQTSAAAQLKLTQQAISQALERGQHEDLTLAEDAVRLWLAGLLPGNTAKEAPRGTR